MKRLTKVFVSTLMLLLLLSFCGCSSITENMVAKFEDPEIRQQTEQMIDCMLADEADNAYVLFQNYCTKEEFDTAFPQLRDTLGQTDSYELKLLSIYTNTYATNSQPVSYTTATYELLTNTDKFIIVSQTESTNTGLRIFQLAPYKQTDYYFTGTLTTMKDANALQWIVLLSNIICIGLGVFAIVDCCRHHINKKVLWILITALGFLTIAVTVSSTRFHINFNLGWITAYSAFVRYGSGAIVARIMLPVGPILYLIRRRALLRSTAPVAPTEPEETQSAEEA